MSQRDSGYERKERDCYETPRWVTLCLDPYIGQGRTIWEPACASGKMVSALKEMGHTVVGSDITDGSNFFHFDCCMNDSEGIVTNPPYGVADEFIWHAIALTSRMSGFVAMLLRTDFDHAKSRTKLFRDHPAFWMKVVLMKRIRWFEDSKGSPSFNHAWFIWDWRRTMSTGRPHLSYEDEH